MHGGVVGARGEETVVEKGSFEDEVDEEVERVPDEEHAQTGGGVRGEGTQGEEVGAVEDHDDRGERDKGDAVEVVHD